MSPAITESKTESISGSRRRSAWLRPRDVGLYDRHDSRPACRYAVALARRRRPDVLARIAAEGALRDEAVAEGSRAAVRQDPGLATPAPDPVGGVVGVDVEVPTVLVLGTPFGSSRSRRRAGRGRYIARTRSASGRCTTSSHTARASAARPRSAPDGARRSTAVAATGRTRATGGERCQAWTDQYEPSGALHAATTSGSEAAVVRLAAVLERLPVLAVPVLAPASRVVPTEPNLRHVLRGSPGVRSRPTRGRAGAGRSRRR